jgi:type IV fimbrial biogenesis protein FimT
MSLVEMMIGVALLAVLMTMAVPSFSGWIRNLGIRNAAESIQSGLALARNEALKRNTAVRFQLTTSVDGDCGLYEDEDPTWAWVVSRDDAVTDGKCGETASETDSPYIVQSYDGKQSNGDKVRIFADDHSLFKFNGLGRLIQDLESSPANILVTDAEGEDNCVSEGGTARCLRVDVTAGGVRMCDPALPATDTQACG